MAADPITAGFNALAGFFGVLKPSIDEHFAQKYENEYLERTKEFQGIISSNDSPDRASNLGSFTDRLCSDAGTPPGQLSGKSIEVPLEYYESLVIIAAKSIRDSQKLAKITFTQG